MAMEIVMGINLPNMKQMLEDCHDSKSKEFSKCMDLLIEAFADPSTNDRIKKILLDHSPVRRCLIAIFERIIYLDWQRSRFKELSHPLIYQVCLIIFSIVDEIKFCDDKTWFGGVSSVRTFTLVCTSPAEETSTSVGSSQQQRLNSIYYFSIGIIILGLMNKSEAIRPIDVAINAFLKRLESLYCSPSIFIDALLENDERCLSTLTALLNLWNNRECTFYAFELSISSLLDPDILLLSLLQKLHFDSLTFVDWIYSEPELSYVFLKTYSQHLAQLSMQQIYDICNRFCKLPQNNEAKYDINRMEMDSSPSSSESNLTFAIEELHGEQTYSICQRQERRIADAESMCSSLYNFLVKLNSKLDKLCPAIHFPVKIICQNLSTIEATMSGNAFYD